MGFVGLLVVVCLVYFRLSGWLFGCVCVVFCGGGCFVEFGVLLGLLVCLGVLCLLGIVVCLLCFARCGLVTSCIFGWCVLLVVDLWFVMVG